MLMIFIILNITTSAFGQNIRQNPPRNELEEKLEALAKKRGVPTVIVKAIAKVESGYQQYTRSGNVYTGSRGSIGIMQINNRYGDFDSHKLKYDIDYNLEAGIEMILRKWDMAVKSLPNMGNMDPNVLENWYFALWAYNGWADSNNTNTNKKKYTYQELIAKVALEEYGQEITLLDPKLLPKTGKPSKNVDYKTPAKSHKGDIIIYKKDQYVRVDTTTYQNLRNKPNGDVITTLKNKQKLRIIEGPTLNNGYYWYKVAVVGTKKVGWLRGNWITIDDGPFKAKEKLKIDSKKLVYLKDSPNGKELERLLDKEVLTYIEGPIFKNDINWIKIKLPSGNEGWTEMDCLLKIISN